MAKATSSKSNTQGKPLRSDHAPEAHASDRAGLPADTGAGDPDTNTPRGSSGTAREASSTDSGSQIDGSVEGAQPGSPNADFWGALKDWTDFAPPGNPKTPLLIAAWVNVVNENEGQRGVINLRITSKVHGFRRAGVAHVGTKVWPMGLRTFSPWQVEELMAEPNLITELVFEASPA